MDALADSVIARVGHARPCARMGKLIRARMRAQRKCKQLKTDITTHTSLIRNQERVAARRAKHVVQEAAKAERLRAEVAQKQNALYKLHSRLSDLEGRRFAKARNVSPYDPFSHFSPVSHVSHLVLIARCRAHPRRSRPLSVAWHDAVNGPPARPTPRAHQMSGSMSTGHRRLRLRPGPGPGLARLLPPPLLLPARLPLARK